jgi:hypothetical protein
VNLDPTLPQHLNGLNGRPCTKKKLTPEGLRHVLRNFGVPRSRNQRIGDQFLKGFTFDHFARVWESYLPHSVPMTIDSYQPDLHSYQTHLDSYKMHVNSYKIHLDSYPKTIARKISPMFSTPIPMHQPNKEHFLPMERTQPPGMPSAAKNVSKLYLFPSCSLRIRSPALESVSKGWLLWC